MSKKTVRKAPARSATAASSRDTKPRGVKFWLGRIGLGAAVFALLVVSVFAYINPPTNFYQASESFRLGGLKRQWVDFNQIAPDMSRAVVAGEDANFCLHWGFDMGAIRTAIKEGGERGASTITQQVVKNVFLWQQRSWLRKALEAMLTPVVEVIWSKRRILEVYLNVAEFASGVFGVQAAAQHYFGVDANRLTRLQAARLAAILPDPKKRSASRPSRFVGDRAGEIVSGMETIAVDGRDRCFLPS